MTYEEFHALIDAHIVHAKEKHPLFAHRLVDATMEYYDAIANSAKLSVAITARDGHCPATTVVLAEVYEFFTSLQPAILTAQRKKLRILLPQSTAHLKCWRKALKVTKTKTKEASMKSLRK